MTSDQTEPVAGIDPAGLLLRARELRAHAYAPYSNFRVGAVVVTDDGQRFEGVNVENASLRLTSCAEQSAIASMIAAGVRRQIVAVAVVGDGQAPCVPCGACRQTIVEFGPSAAIYASGDAGQPLMTTVAALLPEAFGAGHLDQGPTQ